MKTLLLHFLNPLAWYRAYRFKREQKKFDKSTYDLELYLYSKILTNDMLHYGYFENIDIRPEEISLQHLEDAQVKYAENIIDHIKQEQQPILDVGCGMGGLAKMILDRNLSVECLTPNKNQIEHISTKYPSIVSHHMKFEEFRSDQKYGTVIHSESLQYVDLDKTFEIVNETLKTDGRWIIVDYFRKDGSAHQSGHLYNEFVQKVENEQWKISYQKDITENVLPTIAFANMYVERFLLPLKHFAFEKFRFKRAVLYFMANAMRKNVNNKIDSERKAIDPVEFRTNKQYQFIVLERS